MESPQARALGANWEDGILQKVSRSFALTIPQLPEGLRERVANAYLLCRIIDTIEDENQLTLSEKRDFFNSFMDVVDGKRPTGPFVERLHPRLAGNTLSAEKELVSHAGAVLDIFFKFSPDQQLIIRRCLRIMAFGMLRFQEIQNPEGLRDLAYLNGYCYHVAGVVGEMLTDLFCDYSDQIARNRDPMLARAASFGQGLQMTNILKDLWEDRDRGACWLPKDVFNKTGFDLARLKRGTYSPRFGDGLKELIGIAHHHLKNALSYTLFIPQSEKGIRRFCLWAIGMALLTLRNINQCRSYTCGEEVKISRSDVKTIVSVCNLTLWNDLLLRGTYRIAARGLPLNPVGQNLRTPLRYSDSPIGISGGPE